MDHIHLLKAILVMFWERFIRNVRKINIFRRLIGFSLIIILLPNFTISFFSFDKFSGEIDSMISDYSSKVLKNLDNVITEQLRKYSDLTDKLCLDNELKTLLRKCSSIHSMQSVSALQKQEYDNYKKKIGNILYDKTSLFPDIVNAEIISDYDEFTLVGYNGTDTGAKVADLNAFRNSPYYKKAVEMFYLPVWWDTSKEKNIYTSQRIPSAFISQYITVLRSIHEPGAGVSLGVIVINISLNSLSKIFNNKQMITWTESLLLLSSSGIMQYHNRMPFYEKIDHETIQDIVSIGTGTLIRKISKTEYLISAIKSDYTGWTLCSIIPRKSLLQSVYEIRNFILLICIICILVAFFMSYIVNVSISIPVKNLKTAMEKIDEENINIDYHDNIHDEVGILGQKFNSMIKRIQNLINSVYVAELTRKEEEIRRKKAELDALQMQINPHFLYNTLDIIRWQALAEGKPEGKTARMIASFSKLLRFSTKLSSSLVTIKEELEHIDAYIRVICFDINYNLKLDLIIEDESILNCKIPKLTIQPLVENCIKHGFVNNQSEYKITICSFIAQDDIFIEIQDNGVGIPKTLVESINNSMNEKDSHSEGVGLLNVNERIKLNFGDKYGLKLNSQQGKYTTAIIHIPRVV